MLSIAEQVVSQGIEFESQQHEDNVVLTKTELKRNADRIRLGQWSALIAFISVSLGGFYMVHLGHDALGIAVLVFEAVGVAGVFLHQFRRDQHNQTRPASGQGSARPDQVDA